MKPFFCVLSACLAGLLSLIALPVMAADPFTVARVPVDATADSVIEAQNRALGAGQVAAARQLIDRLTLPSERADVGVPPLSASVVGPLIRGISIDDERRSATRYLGDVSVSFNPSAVQTLLRDAGLTMIISQARERLVIPVDIDPDGPLARELLSGRHAHALTPIRSVSQEDMEFQRTDPTDEQLRLLADRFGVEQVLILRQDDSGAVRATDLSLDTGARRTLGSRRGLSGLVAQMEADWKATSAVSSRAAQTATVSVLYDSLGDWQRLQRAINNSTQVRDARLDALSADGALMTLSFGSVDRLAAEMAQKGVRVIEDPDLGLVIRR